MKERPIIMRGDEVRAILEGRKSQTRRVMKPQPQPNGIWSKSLGYFLCLIDEYPPSATIWNGAWLGADAGELNCCPYGVPGDRLWVRESAYIAPPNFCDAADCTHRDTEGRPRVVGYAAVMDGESVRFATDYGVRKTPSIHMPRWASRLTLEIKSVRVERVQEISEEDAVAEGIEQRDETTGGGDRQDYQRDYSAPDRWFESDPISSYRTLWESIHGAGTWDANPWVWCITFERVKQGA